MMNNLVKVLNELTEQSWDFIETTSGFFQIFNDKDFSFIIRLTQDKLEVFGTYIYKTEEGLTINLPNPGTRIFMSNKKRDIVIAKDILRRFVPKYQEELSILIKEWEHEQEVIAKKLDLFDVLLASTDSDTLVNTNNFSFKRIPHINEVQIVEEDVVNFDLSVNAKQAQQIVKILFNKAQTVENLPPFSTNSTLGLSVDPNNDTDINNKEEDLIDEEEFGVDLRQSC